MNDDLKQIQGIKRPYDSNPTTTSAGYQPVAKKKKGHLSFALRTDSIVYCLARRPGGWHDSPRIDSYHVEIIRANDRR